MSLTALAARRRQGYRDVIVLDKDRASGRNKHGNWRRERDAPWLRTAILMSVLEGIVDGTGLSLVGERNLSRCSRMRILLWVGCAARD